MAVNAPLTYPGQTSGPIASGATAANGNNGIYYMGDGSPFKADAKTAWLDGQAVDAQLKGYIPLLFAKATMKEFYDNSILPRITNVQYEAELKKMGDKIYIRRKPDIKIGAYKVGKDVSYQELAAPEPIEVVVDKGYDWAFREHDVVSYQTDIKQYISELMTKIAQRIRDYIEPTALQAIIAELIATDVNRDNNGANAGVATKAYNLGTVEAPINLSSTGTTADQLSVEASNLIADLYGTLHEQNVLEGGKTPFIVAPHRFLNVLAKSALQNASFVGDGSTLRRGQKSVGMIQGCELYTSNYVKCAEAARTGGGKKVYTDVFPILCGTTDAVTWIQTITKTEKFRDQTQYADLHRGMGIYGFKVIEPKCLAVAWVKFTPGATPTVVEYDADGKVVEKE